VLAEVVAAIAAPSVLVIGERVREAAVERVPLRPCVLLQIGVLMGGGGLSRGRRSGTGGDSVRIKLCGY
jgi:hypothetical protein